VPLTFFCQIHTLAYPRAALLVFCLALMAANAVAVIKAALRAMHGDPAEEMSGCDLALERRSRPQSGGR
jgi:hypothetical protein